MSDRSWASVAPYSALSKPPNNTSVVDGDLAAAQIAVGDLAVVQDAQRLPHARNGNRLDAIADRRSARRGVRVQRPAAVEGRDADRRGVGDAELTDGDRHQRAMLDGAAHRGCESVRSRGPAAAPCARADAARRRCVGAGRTAPSPPSCCWSSQVACSTSGPVPAGRTTVRADTTTPTPGHRPDRAVQRHLESGGADDEDDQRADEPADRQAEQ